MGLLLFWSFLLLSLFSLKREDSCSKSLHLSCKMTIFNLSLFFLKFLCRSILRDWDQDFWAIIFEWILFYGMTIGKAYTFSNFALEGGGAVSFGSPCIVPEYLSGRNQTPCKWYIRLQNKSYPVLDILLRVYTFYFLHESKEKIEKKFKKQ